MNQNIKYRSRDISYLLLDIQKNEKTATENTKIANVKAPKCIPSS